MLIDLCDGSMVSEQFAMKEMNCEFLKDALDKHKDEFLLIRDLEVDRISPLNTINDDGNEIDYHDFTLYNLLTYNFKNKKIYYETADYNIIENINRLKTKLKNSEKYKKLKTNVIPLINPLLYSYTTEYSVGSLLSTKKHTHVIIPSRNKLIFLNCKNSSKSEKKFDLKYNVVSLNCTKKFHRLQVIKKFYNHEKFIYSYYPFEDLEQLENCFGNSYDKKFLNELTELNEIYDNDVVELISDVNIKNRSKEEIIKTIATKNDAFQKCVPMEYMQSCIDLVTEAYVGDSVLLTEKTFKPIGIKKPFILLGAKNSHKFLKKIGFLLYDELFDYSFDDKSYDERFYSVTKQIENILKIPTKELIKKIHSIDEKIRYNHYHLKRINHSWSLKTKNLNVEKYIFELQAIQSKYVG